MRALFAYLALLGAATDDVATNMADRAEHEMASWTSIELDVRTDVTRELPLLANNPKTFILIDAKYIETSRGQRYLDQRSTTRDGEITRTEFYSDGKRFAGVDHSPTLAPTSPRIVETGNFGLEGRQGPRWTDHPAPLRYFYLNAKPIHEVIRNGQFERDTTVAGRSCAVILVDDLELMPSQPVALRVALDRESGVPLRVTQGADPQKPDWVWETRETKEIDGRLVPWVSSLTSWRGADRSNVRETVHTVSHVAFNREYPANTFWPDPLANASIEGTDATDVSGAATQPQVAPATTAQAKPSQASPPLTVENTPETPWLPRGLLIAGIAALASAAILTVRRRK